HGQSILRSTHKIKVEGVVRRIGNPAVRLRTSPEVDRSAGSLAVGRIANPSDMSPTSKFDLFFFVRRCMGGKDGISFRPPEHG
ncbi:MAG: hypothetical protein WD066_10830, partial [Planctomycetaceae bacterium]